MWCTGLVAPRHVGSSGTRAQTRVPCIGRWILNHCPTREVSDSNNSVCTTVSSHIRTRVPRVSLSPSLSFFLQNLYLYICREEVSILLAASFHSQTILLPFYPQNPLPLKLMRLPLLVNFNYLFRATPQKSRCLWHPVGPFPFVSYMIAGDFNNCVEALKNSKKH